MKLMTKTIERKLKQNHETIEKLLGDDTAIKPIVKFFGGSATWLISEMHPDNDTLFGLCDLGLGTPDYGTVSLSELQSLKIPPFGLGVERDLLFIADKTLSKYADDAQISGRISA